MPRHLVASLLIGCALTSASCRSASDYGVQRGVEGGIGDDVCGVLVAVDVAAKEPNGNPVAGAEVWAVGPFQPDPPFRKAYRIGLTDTAGHLGITDCYIGSSEYESWEPGPTVRLEYFIAKEGYRFERIVSDVPTEELLRTGGFINHPPGQRKEPGYLAKEAWPPGYLLKLHVVLVPARLVQ